MVDGRGCSKESPSHGDERKGGLMTRRRFLLLGGTLGLAGLGAVGIGFWKWRWLFGKREWRYIVIHHSASTYGNAKTFEAWHRKRGMRFGMAYHFVIGNWHGLGDGQVEVGSRWKKQLWGAHLGNWKNNLKSIGICLVANFETGTYTQAQMVALKHLVMRLGSRYDISIARIRGHKEMPGEHTLCPGRHFDLKEMRRDLDRC